MTWLDGEPFEAVRAWPEPERRQVALILLRLFLESAFLWRFLHADPHPGNFRFLRDRGIVRVGVLDFGCVTALGADRARTLSRLVGEGPSLSFDRVLADYLSLGFNADLLEPMAHLLPAVNRLIFEPFATEGPFSLSDWRLNERIGSLLGQLRWNLRFAGPPDLILLLRAYLGLIRYVRALRVDVDWSEAWDATVGRSGPAAVPAPCPAPAANHRDAIARHLRVAVSDGGRSRVDLTFRAAAAESLPDLIPDDLAEKLRDRRLDVRGIADAAVAGGFAPGELFRLAEGSKLVRVWLE